MNIDVAYDYIHTITHLEDLHIFKVINFIFKMFMLHHSIPSVFETKVLVLYSNQSIVLNLFVFKAPVVLCGKMFI